MRFVIGVTYGLAAWPVGWAAGSADDDDDDDGAPLPPGVFVDVASMLGEFSIHELPYQERSAP